MSGVAKHIIAEVRALAERLETLAHGPSWAYSAEEGAYQVGKETAYEMAADELRAIVRRYE